MFNQVLFYFLTLTLAFVLLYPKFPLINIAGIYVSIRIEDLIILFIFFIWFLSQLKNLSKILKLTIIQLFLLFWAIGLVSLLSAFLITYFVPPYLGVLHWLRRIETMSLFFVAAATLKSVKQLRIFLIVMLLVVLAVTVYGFGQVYLNFPVISTTNSEFAKGLILRLTPGARPNSTFAGHYDLAVFLSVALIFLGTLFFHYKKIWPKVLIVLAGIFSAGLLGLTAARASFAATLISLALVFWVTGKRILIVGLIAASLVILIASPQLRQRLVATLTVNIIGGGGPKYEVPKEVLELQERQQTGSYSAEIINASASTTGTATMLPRDIAPGEPINTTELGVERSFNIRTDVEWPRAVAAFEKNPLLGTGYASLTDPKGNALATDNDYLRSLGETGILGTISLGLIFLLIFKKLTRGIRERKGLERLFLIGTLYSLIAVLLTGVVIDVLEASKIATLLWVMLGMGYAVANNYEEDN